MNLLKTFILNSHYEHHLKITQMVMELNGNLLSVKKRLQYSSFTLWLHYNIAKMEEKLWRKKREVKN